MTRLLFPTSTIRTATSRSKIPFTRFSAVTIALIAPLTVPPWKAVYSPVAAITVRYVRRFTVTGAIPTAGGSNEDGSGDGGSGRAWGILSNPHSNAGRRQPRAPPAVRDSPPR